MEFKLWLLAREAALVDTSVARSYDRGFEQGLQDLIARTRDSGLRSTLERMRQCNVRDQSGGCRSFTDYILGALIRNRCGLADPEESLAQVYRQLMAPTNLQGQPRATLFGSFDEARPFAAGTNPVEARFKTTVTNGVRNLCQADRRAARQGNLSIVPEGRREEVSPDTIADDDIPQRSQGAESELLDDILGLLRGKQGENPGIPLVDLFQSIINGEAVTAQRAKFGWHGVEVGRKVIVQTLADYARSTENWSLLRLLDKIRQPGTKAKTQPKPAKVKLTPDQQDYASIIGLMERHGETLTLAQLQKDRRRWTEWSPRDPNSPHPNRLEDVLARMVADGVLEERRTRKGGRYYVPGQNYQRYLARAGV